MCSTAKGGPCPCWQGHKALKDVENHLGSPEHKIFSFFLLFCSVVGATCWGGGGGDGV